MDRMLADVGSKEVMEILSGHCADGDGGVVWMASAVEVEHSGRMLEQNKTRSVRILGRFRRRDWSVDRLWSVSSIIPLNVDFVRRATETLSE